MMLTLFEDMADCLKIWQKVNLSHCNRKPFGFFQVDPQQVRRQLIYGSLNKAASIVVGNS